MSVAKIVELTASSPDSFEEACRQGIAKASETLRGIQGVWVDGQEVSFHGVDPNLGEVTFTGALDVAALMAAKAAGPGYLEPGMQGVLRIGDQEFRNITFKYFGGE